jgi:hypothetical protein
MTGPGDVADIETGSHPAGGFWAKLGKTVARGDTPASATAALVERLGLLEPASEASTALHIADWDALVAPADDVYEAFRALCHRTMHQKIPAPLLYRFLGNLGAAGHNEAQLLRQLADGLAKSVAQDDVYDLNGDPRETSAVAIGMILHAASLAEQMGNLLNKAQVAINSQGLNDPVEETP